MAHKRKRKSLTERGAGEKKDLPLGSSELLKLPQLHPQKKECEKGQSKQNSSKVLKVLVEHANRGRQTWLGYDDLLFFTLTCTWVEKELLRAAASEAAEGGGGGREEEAGGSTQATLILDNFSHPLIGKIASLGKYGAFDI